MEKPESPQVLEKKPGYYVVYKIKLDESDDKNIKKKTKVPTTQMTPMLLYAEVGINQEDKGAFIHCETWTCFNKTLPLWIQEVQVLRVVFTQAEGERLLKTGLECSVNGPDIFEIRPKDMSSPIYLIFLPPLLAPNLEICHFLDVKWKTSSSPTKVHLKTSLVPASNNILDFVYQIFQKETNETNWIRTRLFYSPVVIKDKRLEKR